jgi:hypothetical protein
MAYKKGETDLPPLFQIKIFCKNIKNIQHGFSFPLLTYSRKTKINCRPGLVSLEGLHTTWCEALVPQSLQLIKMD